MPDKLGGGGQKDARRLQKRSRLLGMNPMTGVFDSFDLCVWKQASDRRFVLGADIVRAGACEEQGRTGIGRFGGHLN